MNIFDSIVVTDVIDTITVRSLKGRNEKMYNRTSYGLSFCIGGQITYNQNGKEYISDEKNAVILPKGQSYSIHGDKEGFFPVINFDCADFLCNEITVIQLGNRESLLNNYEEIKKLFLYAGSRTKIMSIFYDILNCLSSYTINDNILLPAIHYIEKNYQDPSLTALKISSKCLISEIYLRKLFDKHLKTTPKQFVICIRLQKAKQLLSEGVLKINAVSEQCGFSNPYHFCRTFKKKTGLTPTEYRANNQIQRI